ncbi:MAG TPA: GGDEF domain-containing protein [Polyangiales bacterium]
MRNPDLDITLVTDVVSDPTPSGSLAREGTLTVLAGADVGATFTLGAQVTEIGRSPDCHVMLADESVSRAHARIVRVGKQYELEDLGSTNGTLVTDQRIEGRVLLQDGTRLQLGRILLRFALQDEIDQQASVRMYEMSVRDGLTGMYNRRYLDERIVAEFAFAARHRAPLCVLLCDIDHFKNINDRHGHHAGDHVLRELGAQLRACVRTEDVLARYGGEEFAIIARGVDVAGGQLFAERIRGVAERMQVSWEGKRIVVTLSVGVAHTHAGAPATKAQALVAAADSALYSAKRAGRNRCELAASPGRYVGVDADSNDAARDTSKPPPAPSPARHAVTKPLLPAAGHNTRTK